MALRCLLFSSDEGTAEPIRLVLAGLGVTGEFCSDAMAAAEKVTNQNFQIVIIDWDNQPEAPLLLTTARERKAAERPLTLAMVSDDASVPQALQAGANSILRKPIQLNQVRDTLTTARDLLRVKQETAAVPAQAAVAAASTGSAPNVPTSLQDGKERNLRGTEFLYSSSPAPGGRFVTESDEHESLELSPSEPVDPLKDLEPMAASVTLASITPASITPGSITPASVTPVSVTEAKPAPQTAATEPRGLQWYLKTRSGTLPPNPVQLPSAAPSDKPELLGYDQTPAQAPRPSSLTGTAKNVTGGFAPPEKLNQHDSQNWNPEQKKEAALFAYIDGERREPDATSGPPFRLGKKSIIGALVLAGCAIIAAPQAPWHPAIRVAWTRGRLAMHSLLNPQPVTLAPAPMAHETFGRAGDEYKLPVAENIPDATTDPSQIQVVPVIDPTAKKPNNEGANLEQPAGPPDGSPMTPTDQTPVSTDPERVFSPQSSSDSSQPAAETSEPETSPAPSSTIPSSGSKMIAAPVAVHPHAETPSVLSSPSSSSSSSSHVESARPKPQPHNASNPGNVPSSLKSHMVSMTPDASGNKLVETAMPSIEPVSVPEFAERALLVEQPAVAYPPSAKGQQGTVVLQVLVGRDGTVQDAKFLQGSLAFARAAIDGVRQWKFRPYTMNGRAVSVQTLLTISVKPVAQP